jgi:hypothetical protein
MSTRSLCLLSMLTFALPACGGQTDVPGTDDASLADDAKADRAGGGSSYYLIRPDLRRCAAPGCGGSSVKRVNFSTTTCVDGSTAAECYVATTDYSNAGLDDNDMAAVAGRPLIVKASIARTHYAAGTYGTLMVSEAWIGAVGSAPNAYATVDAVVYRVKDNGVRCITTPCPSDRETKLNGTTARNIAGVDLQGIGASDDQISDAYVAMTTTDGALVDGSNVSVTGPGGSMYQLDAANFYAKVVHATSTGGSAQSCGGIAGLTCPSGQWCDPQPANACGGADLLGVCKDPGFVCAQVYIPVCGCDGKTYGNDCMRVQSKVQLAHEGACAN